MTLLPIFFYSVQALCAFILIGLVLAQQGKGADAAGSFGAGGASAGGGSANALSRATAIVATIFFCCTLALAYLSSHAPVASSVLSAPAATPTTSEPAHAPK